VKIVRADHAGLCPSINAAAKMLTGKYFGWVDSDDAIAPNALAETVQFSIPTPTSAWSTRTT
jgi:glycosyltransferase involved in cell wall biosynthesis